MIAKRVIFVGRVQGVGFRFTTLGAAKRCGLVGYVRNLPNGTVEMLAQGRAEAVTDCIDSLKETYADGITEIKIEDVPFDPVRTEFKLTF